MMQTLNNRSWTLHSYNPTPGSLRAYFRGNGANVVKIAPETALKLTLNDTFKQFIVRQPDSISPVERMVAGGIAGAVRKQ